MPQKKAQKPAAKAKAKTSRQATKQEAAAPPKAKRMVPKFPTRAKPVIRTSDNKLTGSFRLFQDSFGLLRSRWRLFAGLMLVYTLLTLVLLGGIGQSVTDIKDQLSEALGGRGGFWTGALSYTALIGTLGTGTHANGTAFQAITSIVVSLAVIWSLRQTISGHAVTVRDAFYKGMYPLVPFVLVLLVIGLQLIPVAATSFVVNALIATGVAGSGLAQVLGGLFLLAALAWSVYMVSSSIFAIYIVSLPDTGPMVAVRTARELVRGRRWTVLRKLLFLPVALLLLGGLITIPLIIVAPLVAQAVFMILTATGLLLTHSYIYNLYRELL